MSPINAAGMTAIANQRAMAAVTPPTPPQMYLGETLAHLSKTVQELHIKIDQLEGKLIPLTGPIQSIYANTDGTDKQIPEHFRSLDSAINSIFDACDRLNKLNASLLI